MTIRGRITLFSVTLGFALPIVALAQAPAKTTMTKPKHETQAQLQKDAKVSLADATATAQKEVPEGKIASHELEHEKGKLIYSFDIKVAGKSGIDEVNVDAMTGAMIEKVHESPAYEAKEAAADRKAMKPPVKKP
ncbi:MAG: PepSY domain-containing protein [Gemmatimonadales bacterium]